MKTLSTLVRLHRFRLDERRREQGELERLVAGFNDEIERLATEVVTEQSVAAASLEAGFGYGAYAQGVIERRERLELSLAQAEARLAEAVDKVNAAFREAKRHELLLAERRRQRAAEEARLEQIDLDEVSIDGFRRRAGQR